MNLNLNREINKQREQINVEFGFHAQCAMQQVNWLIAARFVLIALEYFLPAYRVIFTGISGNFNRCDIGPLPVFPLRILLLRQFDIKLNELAQNTKSSGGCPRTAVPRVVKYGTDGSNVHGIPQNNLTMYNVVLKLNRLRSICRIFNPNFPKRSYKN